MPQYDRKLNANLPSVTFCALPRVCPSGGEIGTGSLESGAFRIRTVGCSKCGFSFRTSNSLFLPICSESMRKRTLGAFIVIGALLVGVGCDGPFIICSSSFELEEQLLEEELEDLLRLFALWCVASDLPFLASMCPFLFVCVGGENLGRFFPLAISRSLRPSLSSRFRLSRSRSLSLSFLLPEPSFTCCDRERDRSCALSRSCSFRLWPWSCPTSFSL